LVEAYLAAPDYATLAAKTRRDYRRYLDRLAADCGSVQVRAIGHGWVLQLRDRFAATPRSANYLIQVLRLLMTFAVDRGWRPDNPALRPKRLKTGDGHRPWEEDEIARFRARWAADTVQRVAFELMLNTGQRGGDVIRLVGSQVRSGRIKLRQGKTGALVDIPCSADLAAVLNPWLEARQAAVLLVTGTGRPFKADHFRHTMRAAYQAANLPPGCTSHGLRYTAATRLREIGCDWQTIASITGHETVAMVRKYIEQRRMARIAVERLNML
jgi:integrase